jgi:hypothetical protein
LETADRWGTVRSVVEISGFYYLGTEVYKAQKEVLWLEHPLAETTESWQQIQIPMHPFLQVLETDINLSYYSYCYYSTLTIIIMLHTFIHEYAHTCIFFIISEGPVLLMF